MKAARDGLPAAKQQIAEQQKRCEEALGCCLEHGQPLRSGVGRLF